MSTGNKKYLQVVLKTIERCNINCSYCYVFNMQDKSYLKHPKYISENTIDHIIEFLKQGALDYSLDHIGLIFIGGEPLMQKKKVFSDMCEKINKELSPLVKICFSLQTNGILIDEEWIDIFNQFNIGIGISLDGTKEQNDKFRVDHRNRGTHDRVVKKLKLMQQLYRGKISFLSVINDSNSAIELYNHFVNELDVKSFDFLLPDYNHENKPSDFSAKSYGKFLKELFHEWTKDLSKKNVNIRMITAFFRALFDKTGILCGQGVARVDDLPLISIATDGELGPMDELRNTDPKLVLDNTFNVKNTTLREFLEKDIFSTLKEAQVNQPEECKNCCWKQVCNAGALVNRYSHQRKFDNPSIYCDGLKDYYSEIAAFLIKNGYSKESLLQHLGIQ